MRNPIAAHLFITTFLELTNFCYRKTADFGLTAVVLTENLRFLDQWSQYLSQKMDRKIEFVLRKSYQDVMDLLDSGGIEFAWICGYPYVQTRKPESLQLLTVPIQPGPVITLIIVYHSSTHQHFQRSERKVFPSCGPDSNSGFLFLLVSMTKVKNLKPFSPFLIMLICLGVSEQVADWPALIPTYGNICSSSELHITEKTRIIKTSPSFGFPPIVSRIGVNDITVSLMKSTLENMDEDSATVLERLKWMFLANFNENCVMAYKTHTAIIYSMLPTD
ncbi:MAG: PhnD/SsuA/transferrin family substrate-binding protein [Candidatus Thiodiazotropha sp. (ex. Lucinoma kazani)]